ncbi:IspA Geranylgeranyl pyrophosphate synthase [Pyrenophora tritici-repentis]|uniref:geranylgeranyl diphosphate synthase n=1 Tax=Pyrenophora tritici-repentis TaxID=45151 RepID=A0A317A3D8_9PLEO|nr:Geranylgeranyl pyrophosphate synthase [Pyrenophora tritici-repentis]KAI1517367.1 Geranylgeranyl pyrophosphate synthase [Pyrenophora tritici-repentis]KAI1530351.1 IspA Geranylgeranyl pyrophosphate synthase [Pyrenophora tritici-repentis]KAI1562515.1 IspA Geranylgeranyl pyrophosphate synthase [Pyrenophora tritici-repentis]KAI1670096.1 Geranylgeranyl pyrophosphate synthase [Pyrenophora tritici-repentis]
MLDDLVCEVETHEPNALSFQVVWDNDAKVYYVIEKFTDEAAWAYHRDQPYTAELRRISQEEHNLAKKVDHVTSKMDGIAQPSLTLLKAPYPIDAACSYMVSLPSKGVRSTLIYALNQWFQISNRHVNLIKEITSMLHNSSFILHDIQDQSPLRREKPAAHTIFGTAQSINSSTYLFVRAMQMVSDNFNRAVQRSFLEILQRMHIGQNYDLHWRFHLICPTEDEYFEMVDQKTGCMFEVLLLLMASKSRHAKEQSFSSFLRIFGRYFQGKGCCEDLDEGKLSYLLIECQRMAPASFAQIAAIFRNNQTDTVRLSPETKSYIISLFKASGALDVTIDLITEMERQLISEVKRLEGQMGEPNCFRLLA